MWLVAILDSADLGHFHHHSKFYRTAPHILCIPGGRVILVSILLADIDTERSSDLSKDARQVSLIMELKLTSLGP